MAMRPYLAAAVLALALTACGGDSPPMPIRDFMAQQVQPTAQVYWDAVRFVSDETGEHDIQPRTDAEWERTRKAAEDLGKFGEQLQAKAYAQGRGDGWNQFAQGLVDVAKQAEQAAADRDPDKVFDVGYTVYSVCSACHQVYPPAAGEATPASR